MRKFVWDTSALLGMKEVDANGYSPAYSFYKDFDEKIIPGPYLNIFPSISIFELSATISRKQRNGEQVTRELWVRNGRHIIYDINDDFIKKCHHLFVMKGFDTLKGADLIFACIAFLENAYLVTLDNDFNRVASAVRVINLNDSKHQPLYRRLFL